MIKKIEWVDDERSIITYQTEDKRGSILRNTVYKYWRAVRYCEGGVARAVNDSQILVFLLANSDQSGIIFTWDVEKNRMIHVSEGDYVINACIDGGSIYTIRYIHFYGVLPSCEIRRYPYPTKDLSNEGTLIKRFDYGSFDYRGDFASTKISVRNRKIYVRDANFKRHCFTIK